MNKNIALCVAGIGTAAICIAAGCGKLCKRDFALVGGNGATARVALPDDPDEATKLAVTELTNYVERVTRRTLPVVRLGSEPPDGKIVIGTLKTLGAAVPAGIRSRLEATDNPEAACIETDGCTLWIVGKDEVADLYATYHFIESKLGVRWFKAETKEDPGDYVPNLATVELAPFSEFREPRFRIRRLDKCGAAGQPISVKAETAAVRNGYQVFPPYGGELPYDKPDSPIYKFYAPRCPHRSVSFGGGHTTFVKPMPAKTCFKDHPEWFALVDGERVPGEQYCFSNPEVQSNTANRVIKLLDKHNGNGAFLFGMVDVTHGWCECDKCRALDPVPANKSSTPNVSTRFNIAVKNMADMIWKKWPKADLRLWAYHTYRILPVGVKQDPKMMVQFCDHGRCYGHHLDDPGCKRNVDMFNLLKDWLTVTPRVYTYEYFTCSDSPYSCHEKDEAYDLRLYAKLGLVGWKNEAAFSDSYFVPRYPKGKEDFRSDRFPSMWQWLYVTSKLLWNPDLDEDAIIDDAESKYYGVAYPAMKKYQALRRKLWQNNRNCVGYPTGDQRRPTLLDLPGAKEELLGYLDEADRLAAGDRIAAHRVGLDRKWLTRYWIKPNEEIKAKAGKAFRAVKATTPIVVDGNGDEGAWAGAYYTDKLYRCFDDRREIDASLATTFGILYDDDNLYFRVRAKEPVPPVVPPYNNGPAWQGDGVEIFLFPPEIDNRYYQIAVNPDGKTFEGVHPAGRGAANFGTKAVGHTTPDGWELEIKVPTGKMHALKAGETWRVLFCRNRIRRNNPSAEGEHYSSDACGYHDTTSYHPMEIGAAYLKNGSFADIGKDGKPVAWALTGAKSKTVPEGKGHAVVLHGALFQTMAHGALGQSQEPRKLRYEFLAKGPGKVNVGFYRYVDTPNRKAKHGYDRKFIPEGGKGGTYTLTDKPSLFSGEYTVPAGEWNSIVLSSQDGATVYSVVVTPLAK